MNAIARTHMAHMEHRQIVTQNAMEIRRKYAAVLTPILFIPHMLYAVMNYFIFFCHLNSNLKLYKLIYFFPHLQIIEI
jgi:hypothetical protein